MQKSAQDQVTPILPARVLPSGWLRFRNRSFAVFPYPVKRLGLWQLVEEIHLKRNEDIFQRGQMSLLGFPQQNATDQAA